MDNRRCIRALVQFAVTTHDERGEPLSEVISQPVQLFRAAQPDIWVYIDQKIADGELKSADVV